VSKTEPSQIPNGLDAVIDYVNTLDREEGTDGLQTPQGLADWLTARGMLDGEAAEPDSTALASARELREALRDLMRANNGAPPSAAAWDALERAARRGRLGVRFSPEGRVSAAADTGGVEGALAGLLAPVAASVDDGTFARAKVCPADDCEWAFYDRSRNRSAVWCEMSVCGNRTKVRTYRDRAREHD
jgi:predicted RNA-binding Zn ribbon-like protein